MVLGEFQQDNFILERAIRLQGTIVSDTTQKKKGENLLRTLGQNHADSNQSSNSLFIQKVYICNLTTIGKIKLHIYRCDVKEQMKVGFFSDLKTFYVNTLTAAGICLMQASSMKLEHFLCYVFKSLLEMRKNINF